VGIKTMGVATKINWSKLERSAGRLDELWKD
jgi:hypothetical protein